ncbi:MAG: hypothetical protein QM492_07500 [Rhodobacterales bacterium]
MPKQAQQVKKRKVFYIPGYDPMLPRRYRELYRTEGGKQAAVSGYDLTLKGTQGKAQNYGWRVDTDIDGQKTHTDFEFLLWSDIVQASMERSIAGSFWLLARTAWAYISTGALFRLMRLQKGPIIAALYPVVVLLGQLLLGLIAGYAVFALVSSFTHWALGLIAGFAALSAVMMWFKSKDNKIYAYYLMHDYAFSAQFDGDIPPELVARMAAFADHIHAALEPDVDEVLVVGHSSGAHLAVSILADLIRRLGVPKYGPKLGFLSLGHVVPMVSFLPKAWILRKDLNYLCQRDELTWVDVTAPGDGCTFALCDPAAVSGVAPEGGHKWPLIFSAAFSQTLSPKYFASIKRKFFRVHFQYLCHFDRPRDYDYFQITGGPVTLETRFQDRAPSPSVITRSVNKYTSQEEPK